MVSYIFSVIEKRLIWKKVVELLHQKHNDFQIVFAVYDKNPDLDEILELEGENIKVLQFAHNDENEMISQAIKHCDGNSLMLCRDYFKYSTVMSDFLLEMAGKGAQVVMFKHEKKASKVSEFNKKILNKLIASIFNFKMYEGDIGLIYFGDIAFSVMKQTNAVLFTKVNKFVGFDISYASIEKLPKPQPQRKNLKKEILKISTFSTLLIALIVGMSLLIALNKIGFVLCLLFITMIILDIFYILYLSLKLDILKRVGDIF